MNGGLRCFVALGLPERLREQVAAYFAQQGRGVGHVRWVTAGSLHLTLQFLGEVPPGQLPAVREAVDAAAEGHAPFALALRGAGAFPSPQRPRVIWVGVADGAAQTSALAAAVGRALAPLGFPPEQRAFTPHLTVGRLREQPPDRGALPRLLEGARDRAWGETVVREAHLMRSELFPAGAVYSILHTATLPGARQEP